MIEKPTILCQWKEEKLEYRLVVWPTELAIEFGSTIEYKGKDAMDNDCWKAINESVDEHLSYIVREWIKEKF